jgi:PilZ domain
MSAEHRRYPRLESPIDGSWDGASGRREVRITSLSLGGCFVDGSGTPAIGERLRVEIRFVDLPTLSLTGEVAYLERAQGFGVRFVDLAVSDAILLARGLRGHGLAQPFGRPPTQ